MVCVAVACGDLVIFVAEAEMACGNVVVLLCLLVTAFDCCIDGDHGSCMRPLVMFFGLWRATSCMCIGWQWLLLALAGNGFCVCVSDCDSFCGHRQGMAFLCISLVMAFACAGWRRLLYGVGW